ncbi:MAG: alkaline phosphatase D family protein [Actinobacteria bacterium]|nr:alkaline phosphatase D family protein [Actinomycetota bacterium]
MNAFSDPFRHGVASGDPLHDRVVLWTRVTPPDDEPVDVTWRVARDAALEDVVGEGTTVAGEGTDYTVHVDATGLEPATTYHYAFDALGRRSPVGRTRTAPRGGAERLRFALVSCAKYTAGYFNVYARVAERTDLDFVLHVGDYIYEYGNHDSKNPPGPRIGRGVEPPHEARTLEDYRTRYAHYRRDPDVQLLHETHPMISTVDDHEFANDAWAGGAEKHDPDTEGDWEVRKAAALRAWREWMPVRLPPPPNEERIYRTLPMGDLADVFMLDGRTKRDRQTQGREMDAPGRGVLGAEEHAWLTGELLRSRARWRLIGNDVMIGQVFSAFMPEELGNPLSEVGILTKREHGPDPDQWDGYTAERDEIFRFLEENRIPNVVFLSGDVHTAWAVELKRDPRDANERAAAIELVTASITTENLDDELGAEPRNTRSLEIERQVAEDNPHVKWVNLDAHGYVLVDVSPERLRGEWWFIPETRRRVPGERREAVFEVRDGEPELVEIEVT